MKRPDRENAKTRNEGIGQFLTGLAKHHEQLDREAAIRGQILGISKEAYKGARVDRLTKHWQPDHRSGDAAIAESWPMLTARTRDQYCNTPTIKRAAGVLTDLIVGGGVQTFASIGDLAMSAASIDLDYALESDQMFEDWADDEADVEGHMSWGDMQRTALQDMILAGDALMLECIDDSPERIAPLCYQLLERDQLDASMDRPAAGESNRIVNGVELDAVGRPVAYWIYDAHPHDGHTAFSGSSFRSTRVPAERVIHAFVRFRPSQHVGISWLHALVQATRDLDWYLGNELTTAAIGALFTAMHTTENPGGALGLTDDEDDEDLQGNELVKLGSGLIYEGGTGDKLEIAESKRPNRDAAPFIGVIRHEQAMGAGISYLRLTGDYKGSSYTAARAAHLDDDLHIKPLQRFFGHRIAVPVRRRFNRMAAGLGRFATVTPREFMRDLRRRQRFTVLGPGREQLDPERETDAAVAKIRTGMSTLEIENGRRQQHWVKILKQRALEDRVAGQVGVVLDFSKQQGGQAQTTTTAATRDGQDSAESE